MIHKAMRVVGLTVLGIVALPFFPLAGFWFIGSQAYILIKGSFHD